MCDGISLLRRDLGESIIERHQLQDRVSARSEQADEELKFLRRATNPLLPVWIGGELQVVTWGPGDSRLPQTFWCREESLADGRWDWLSPESVEVPATFALQNQVWYQVSGGLRGVLVRGPAGRPHAYILTQPASRYYQVMTRSERMPMFVSGSI